MSRVRSLILGVAIAAQASVAWAGQIVGRAVDATGGVLPTAQVTVRNESTGLERSAQADLEGRFSFRDVAPGAYLVTVEMAGFAKAVRTVVVADAASVETVTITLVPGSVDVRVNVTGARGERDDLALPVRADTLGREALEARSPLSTGDALAMAPGVTPVGNGPMQVRPRLRGLDSTRVLVLVDGERLNNARTATDRAGTEVGLIDLNTVDRLEVVGGAGSVLYGTDALSGTVNIITNQPRFSDRPRFVYGLDTSYSTNEKGRRGSVLFGASSRRAAVQVAVGAERFDDYRAGAAGAREETRGFFTSGQVRGSDTIDTPFGFHFRAFPDPFNQPYARSSSTVPASAASGSSLNATGLVALAPNQTLQVKYLARRMDNVGFPDFQQPMFFSAMSLPYNDLDRVSARYEAKSITRRLTNLQVTGYYQDQRRLLRNTFPVQFPVPSPGFFPISVYRLDIVSDTEQHVRTPGLDVQATFVPARHHVVTAGVMVYSDLSEDSRTNSTGTSVVGTVAMGARGPQANVYRTPQLLGPASVTHPVRVPNASFRDIGVFAQDEWSLGPALRVVAGLRVDQYRVATDATAGYDVTSLVTGAEPAIPSDSIPNTAGDRLSRAALTGDIGAVYRLGGPVSLQARYGRSYRHPNLEELLFSGPATVGAIVPNMAVEPEVGNNVDLGIRLRGRRLAGSVSFFTNTYRGFISTEIVATTPSGPVSQAINFSRVRIRGIEGDVDLPVVLRPGVVTFFGNAAYTRGTVLSGENPLTGASLAGTPQDNISPFKAVVGIRFNQARDRWWVEYGVRTQAEVTRVAPTLLDSPYLIPQDLLGLAGFTVQRAAAGVNLRQRDGRLDLVVSVDNLTDRFYREQFQFAPARGRTVMVALHLR